MPLATVFLATTLRTIKVRIFKGSADISVCGTREEEFIRLLLYFGICEVIGRYLIQIKVGKLIVISYAVVIA